jgi:mannan endo-1,6-alpha-mannosidase
MRGVHFGQALLLAGISTAIDVDISDADSIRDATSTIAADIISIYEGQNGPSIPGLFPDKYYWYEAGMAWDSLINYWALTGDDTYNDRVSEAMLFQVGPDYNYMPPNQSASLGNDDQSTWALAAMTAAENDFPSPPSDSGVDSWLQLAQNVFDTQVLRWDTKTCDGGLRWQIYPFNNGYDYKNSFTNGNFMQLAARLYKMTNNQTYSDWAEKVSQWSFDVGFITNGTYDVYDGASTTNDCSDILHIQWTSNIGTYLSGYAYLQDSLAPQLLESAIDTFAETSDSDNDILTEVACAARNNCNTDQLAFRAVLARAFANCKYLDTTGDITSDLDSVLQTSGQNAAAQCTGGPQGTSCGSNWSSGNYDGSTGLSQELSVLEILLANMPDAGSAVSSNGTSSGGSGNGTETSPGGASQTSGGASPSQTGDGAASGLAMSTAGLLGSLVCAIFFTL